VPKFVADSSTATGLAWEAPAAGGGMTLISTTTLTGASVTLSSIPQTYVHLQYIIVNMLPATDGSNLSLAINGDTTASRYFNKADGGNNATGSYGSSIAQITYDMDNASTQGLIWGQIPYYTNATTWKFFQTQSLTNDNTTSTNYRWSFYANGYNQTGAISSLKFQPNSGNFTSGTLYLYGVK
jgi:hypothetical protein